MKAYMIEKNGKYFDVGMAWWAYSSGYITGGKLTDLRNCFNGRGFNFCTIFGSKEECENFNEVYELGGTVKEVEINLVEN